MFDYQEQLVHNLIFFENIFLICGTIALKKQIIWIFQLARLIFKWNIKMQSKFHFSLLFFFNGSEFKCQSYQVSPFIYCRLHFHSYVPPLKWGLNVLENEWKHNFWNSTKSSMFSAFHLLWINSFVYFVQVLKVAVKWSIAVFPFTSLIV